MIRELLAKWQVKSSINLEGDYFENIGCKYFCYCAYYKQMNPNEKKTSRLLSYFFLQALYHKIQRHTPVFHKHENFQHKY